MKVRKAVIPAAGLGTRFLTATKLVPKELLPIVDRPVLELIVEELLQAGIEQIVLVIGPGKEMVRAHFSENVRLEQYLQLKKEDFRLEHLRNLVAKVEFQTVIQKEPLGLGHAVLCAAPAVGNEPFAVVLPDDLVRAEVPILEQMLKISGEENRSTVLVSKVSFEEVSHYGIVGGSERGTKDLIHIERIVEKPIPAQAPSRWAIVGRYVLDPEIFELLGRTRSGALGEIQLTDALQLLATTKGLLGVPLQGERLDVGQPLGFVLANLAYAFDNPDFRKVLRPYMEKLL